MKPIITNKNSQMKSLGIPQTPVNSPLNIRGIFHKTNIFKPRKPVIEIKGLVRK